MEYMTREKLMELALKSYFRRFGKNAEQPNKYLSNAYWHREGITIQLCNVGGRELALFDVMKSGKLRLIKENERRLKNETLA